MSARIVVVLASMLLLVQVHGAITASTVERDLTEITKLHREFLDRSPSVPSRQAYEVRCRAVTECCPAEQDHLYTLFSESQFNDKCLGNGTKLALSSRSSSCVSTLRQLIQLTKDPVYTEYFQLLGNNTNRLNRIKIWKKQMQSICSIDELRAYYCERDNLDKFKSCQRKVLEMIQRENVDDDGTIYKTYVSQWEQEYAIDNQKLAKAFTRP